MERVAASANLNQAYKQVKANRGAPGVMTVDDLRPWLAVHKDALVASLRDGSTRPQPVRGVERRRKRHCPQGGAILACVLR